MMHKTENRVVARCRAGEGGPAPSSRGTPQGGVLSTPEKLAQVLVWASMSAMPPHEGVPGLGSPLRVLNALRAGYDLAPLGTRIACGILRLRLRWLPGRIVVPQEKFFEG